MGSVTRSRNRGSRSGTGGCGRRGACCWRTMLATYSAPQARAADAFSIALATTSGPYCRMSSRISPIWRASERSLSAMSRR